MSFETILYFFERYYLIKTFSAIRAQGSVLTTATLAQGLGLTNIQRTVLSMEEQAGCMSPE